MSHRNIIRCHEVLKSANNCYIITELCEQGNLETLLKQKRSFSEEEIWPYVRDIYEGLRYLAAEGIVHRDLKIANLFLKNGVVKIADFGFAIRTRYKDQYSAKISMILVLALLSTWLPRGTLRNDMGQKQMYGPSG
jgi:serine/threonine protein kinase